MTKKTVAMNQVGESTGSQKKTPARPLRVAHLVSHPIQYFAPLYKVLAQRREIDLTVYFYTDSTLREYVDKQFGRSIKWDVPLTEGYRYRILGRAATAGTGSRAANPSILADLIREKYDVIWVHGYMSANAWLARLIAAMTGGAFLMREEQTLLDYRSPLRRLFKQIMLRPLLWKSWALSIGKQNRRYFLNYGMRPERIFPACYSVDNAFFRAAAQELGARRADIRESFGITDDRPVILFCAKFIDKKQPLLLLEAFEILGKKLDAWLLMVGDGELRPSAVDMARSRNLQRVLFTGFMNQTELPKGYIAADVFVLPSAYQETWGLVVNEAMNYSLPLVVSDRVGCAIDLVEEGYNGFVFPHDDAHALAECLERVCADPDMRRRFGANSLKRVEDYSIERCADGIVEACLATAR